MISKESVDYIKDQIKRFEVKESAIIPALYELQSKNDGWIPSFLIDELSEVMDIPSSRINEVFHFYTMFNKKPVGRYHVQVCANVACAMAGGRELLGDFLKKYGVKKGDPTSDGRFCFSAVECLGACDKAPMMQVNDDYHEGLTNESAHKILEGMK